jgi:hypothetical protein
MLIKASAAETEIATLLIDIAFLMDLAGPRLGDNRKLASAHSAAYILTENYETYVTSPVSIFD